VTVLQLEVLPDADAVAERAAAFVAERAGAAAADHGRFTFAGRRRAHAVGDVRPPG
jgi:hypothetical protein